MYKMNSLIRIPESGQRVSAGTPPPTGSRSRPQENWRAAFSQTEKADFEFREFFQNTKMLQNYYVSSC